MEFGAEGNRRSFPPPNTGPLPLKQKMACPSRPALKAILVGGRPLWLTRLKRKEAEASLYTPEAVKKNFFKFLKIKNCGHKKSFTYYFIEE